MTDATRLRPDDLPLKDFDHLQLGDLGHRIRSLDADGLDTLLAYEQAHARRTHVVQLLRNRRQALAKNTPPTDGDPAEPAQPS